jgi:ADP-glucose pyrophosphorylase
MKHGLGAMVIVQSGATCGQMTYVRFLIQHAHADATVVIVCTLIQSEFAARQQCRAQLQEGCYVHALLTLHVLPPDLA